MNKGFLHMAVGVMRKGFSGEIFLDEGKNLPVELRTKPCGQELLVVSVTLSVVDSLSQP